MNSDNGVFGRGGFTCTHDQTAGMGGGDGEEFRGVCVDFLKFGGEGISCEMVFQGGYG